MSESDEDDESESMTEVVREPRHFGAIIRHAERCEIYGHIDFAKINEVAPYVNKFDPPLTPLGLE